MKTGKLPETVLVRSVLKQVHHRREEVLVGPRVGQDCAVLELGQDEVFVMSSDRLPEPQRISGVTASTSPPMIWRLPALSRWG